MPEINQFIDNLTNTTGWAGCMSIDRGKVRVAVTSSLRPSLTAIKCELSIHDSGSMTYAMYAPTIGEAMTAFEPLLGALFVAKVAQLGTAATYPALAA